MEVYKQEKILKKINSHFRKISRQLVEYDSESEALQCLIDLFKSELNCDFVSVLRKEQHFLEPKVIDGATSSFFSKFPLSIYDCSPILLEESFIYTPQLVLEGCPFVRAMEHENLTSWFTVIIRHRANIYGVCIIGFKNHVPLYNDLHTTITEFGEDIAFALSLASQKDKQKNQFLIGAEWLKQTLTLDSSLEDVITKLVDIAKNNIGASAACFFFYDSQGKTFYRQGSFFGTIHIPEKILIDDHIALKDYFPNFENAGSNNISVALTDKLTIFGVLYVEKSKTNFTSENLDLLNFLAQHAAITLDNIRLYQNEKKTQHKLHSLLDFQQKLIKETINKEGFQNLTKTIGQLFQKKTVIFDRFMRPINHYFETDSAEALEEFVEQATYQNFQSDQEDVWLQGHKHTPLSIWPIYGNDEHVGYMVMDMATSEIDDYVHLSIDITLNILSLQFIKQKLVFRAKEQVKDSIVNRLLEPKVENQEEIIQYANVFQWELFQPHRVAVLKIYIPGEMDEVSILKRETSRNTLEEMIKGRLSSFDNQLIFSTRGDALVLVLPIHKEGTHPERFWNKFYTYIQHIIKPLNEHAELYLGIGSTTSKLEDYYHCFQQAEQAAMVLQKQPYETGIAWYDELGAYTLLYELKEKNSAKLFLEKQIGIIIQYSEGKNTDLLETLRCYLLHNGNIKETSEALFIHRSTLQYRIEKINSLLKVDLADAEQRFNLLLAFKLYELL